MAILRNHLILWKKHCFFKQDLDCGCLIIKPDSEELIYGKTLDTVTVDQHRYYFYLPEAGALMGQQIPFHDESLAGYTAAGNTVIEAGFSLISEEMKKITRSRLYAIPGYYDKSGEYIPRPECLTKTYNRLVRTVKKVAPYTELTDYIISTCDSSCLQKKEWKHKEYFSPTYLALRVSQKYELISSL